MNTTDTAVTAARLGLETRRGWVYRDVSFTAEAGSVTTLLGSTGSGKTAVLLTLAGRMRPSTGSATVAGLDSVREAAKVRPAVGLGLIGGVNDLDDALTAGQHVGEALLFRRGRGDTVRSVLSRVGLEHASATRVRDLDVEQQERLGVGIGLIGGPRVLVVDDIDHDLNVEQQERFMALLRSIARSGVAVIAACIDERTAALGDAVVTLAGADAATCVSDTVTAEPAEEADYAIA